MKKIISIIILFSMTAVFCNAEMRNALLIANGKYKNFSSLSQPIGEAHEFGAALEKIGFDVTIVENATKEDMQVALLKFKKKTSDGGIALIHYGGHAVQVGNKNYLLPVDVDIPSEEYVEIRAMNADEVMISMKGDSNIIILDACRNNPLSAGSSRASTRGLQPIGNKPKKSIIIYSAEPGNVAQDGVFTPILTKRITEQKSFNEIFNEVSQDVYDKTNGTQTPGCYVQLFPTTYLAGREETPARPMTVEKQQEMNAAAKPVAESVPLKTKPDIDPESALDIVISSARQNQSRLKSSTKVVSSREMQNKTVTKSKTKHTVVLTSSGLSIDGRKFKNFGMENILTKQTQIKGDGKDGVFIKKRNVTLSPYQIGVYEITQELFEFVMDDENPSLCRADNQSMYKMTSSDKEELRPVENINFYHAIAFCNKLSLIMGYKPCYYVYGIEDWEDLEFDKIPLVDDEVWEAVFCDWSADGYRLPTEAEWEFAAIGGEKGIGGANTFSGGTKLDKVGWWNGNARAGAKFVGTRMVGKKAKNGFGLFDMSGNVSEWCWDLYGTIDKETVTDPKGAEISGRGHVVRGGHWEAYEDDCRVFNRSRYYRSQYRSNTIGLRLARRGK